MSRVKYQDATEKARSLIVRAECRFAGQQPGKADSFLWEHTQAVAALARRIAREEDEDTGLAYLAALFHDAGKFAGGRYHRNEAPEEIASAAAASRILKNTGFSPRVTNRVTRALQSLYQSGAERDSLADIVHDADFLAKSGRLGVAQFFIKSALRGQCLERALMESLSRELTYAAVLPGNMRTRAGRRRAGRKGAETLRFFRGLLREIADVHGIRLGIKKIIIRYPGKSDRAVPVQLVLPLTCPRCRGRWQAEFSTEKGIKCDRLEAVLRCRGCGYIRRLSFCLPEIFIRPTHQ